LGTIQLLNITVLLGYNDMQFRNNPTFRRNIQPPISESKSKPRKKKKPPEAGGKLNLARLDVFSAKADTVIPTETL
jgi:hypothetical protein